MSRYRTKLHPPIMTRHPYEYMIIPPKSDAYRRPAQDLVKHSITISPKYWQNIDRVLGEMEKPNRCLLFRNALDFFFAREESFQHQFTDLLHDHTPVMTSEPHLTGRMFVTTTNITPAQKQQSRWYCDQGYFASMSELFRVAIRDYMFSLLPHLQLPERPVFKQREINNKTLT